MPTAQGRLGEKFQCQAAKARETGTYLGRGMNGRGMIYTMLGSIPLSARAALVTSGLLPENVNYAVKSREGRVPPRPILNIRDDV
jgi:hypothetical protein